jgi:hypothetical protein
MRARGAIIPPAAFCDPHAMRRHVIAAARQHAAAGGRFLVLDSRLRRELLASGIPDDAHDGLARGLLLAAYKEAGLAAPRHLD